MAQRGVSSGFSDSCARTQAPGNRPSAGGVSQVDVPPLVRRVALVLPRQPARLPRLCCRELALPPPVSSRGPALSGPLAQAARSWGASGSGRPTRTKSRGWTRSRFGERGSTARRCPSRWASGRSLHAAAWPPRRSDAKFGSSRRRRSPRSGQRTSTRAVLALAWLTDNVLAGLTRGRAILWDAQGDERRSFELARGERVAAWRESAGRLIALVTPEARGWAGFVPLLVMNGVGLEAIDLDRVAAGYDPDLGEHGTLLTPGVAYDPGDGPVFVVPPPGQSLRSTSTARRPAITRPGRRSSRPSRRH